MRIDLTKKYDEESITDPRDYDLVLTKSISPYQSNPKGNNKNALIDMAQRLK